MTFKKWYEKNKSYKQGKSLTVYQARSRLIKDIKESSPCVDCGQKYPFYVMQFDHVGEGKFKGVSRMKTYKWERILEEINKCELVCANCHAARTYLRATNFIERRLLP